MILQKHHGASNQKRTIFRRQAAAANPKPAAAPLAPPATKPTPPPNPVKPVTITRPAQPLTVTPTPSKLLPLLLQSTPATVLPSTSNLPPPLPSISVPSTSSSGTSALPSTPASRTRPIVEAITSTNPAPRATTAVATGSTSTNTGVLVGAIVGSCAALGLIVVGVYLLLRRRRQKLKRSDDAFNTSEFRRSAALLDDGREKQGNAQPMNNVERHVQNVPLPLTPVRHQDYYTSAAGYYGGERGRYDDPFAAQPSHSVVQRGPYGVQPAYTYPPNVNPYGYNDPHGYPPQTHYPPQPQLLAQPQQHDVASPSHYTHSEASLPFARQYDAIPSPARYAQSETSLLHHPEPETPSVAVAHDTVPTVQDRHSVEDDGDVPPPAYEITETFVNHRPDVKTRHLTYDAASTISASGSAAASGPVSPAGPSTEPPSPLYTYAGPSTEPPSPFFTSVGPSAEPLSPLFSGPSRHHTLSSRPVSGTSAVTIVYE